MSMTLPQLKHGQKARSYVLWFDEQDSDPLTRPLWWQQRKRTSDFRVCFAKDHTKNVMSDL